MFAFNMFRCGSGHSWKIREAELLRMCAAPHSLCCERIVLKFLLSTRLLISEGAVYRTFKLTGRYPYTLGETFVKMRVVVKA